MKATLGRSEDEIQQTGMIEAAKHDCVLLRNNSGALPDVTGRIVRYGLGNTSKKSTETFASSDTVGIQTITITPDMVGQKIGVFVAVEFKAEGHKFTNSAREIAQNNFIQWVISMGGRAGFADNVDSVRSILRK